ncbi:MAG: family 20 glycosylhydrolase [Bacteroidales bacterium]|nr:family 20 glycosylhydrolase [Bacteroidales bacterium]
MFRFKPAMLFKKINLVLLTLVGFLSAMPGVMAQQDINLIPYPKQLKQGSGFFRILPDSRIVLQDNRLTQTLFSACELISEINKELSLTLHVGSKAAKQSIFIGIEGRDALVSNRAKQAGILLPDSVMEKDKALDFHTEGYLLHITDEEIILIAHSEAGLFYGVQTLKQLIRSNRNGNEIPCMTITDWPSLRYRGWMDDISRGPIPTVDFVKECIRKMAEFKQNFFTLYTEHTFHLEKYPDLAPPGTFTAKEIAELSEYAACYHMDLIGNFQSFGHMEKILANPFFSGLRENGNILNPADESTYQFLNDVYAEIVPAYKSQFFNINCDETQGLGEGKSKAMADSIGTGGIYAYHINRINKLMKPYGKRLMMWGDIAVNNQAIIDQLPKDLLILSWGYGAEESFDHAIIPFKQTGFDFMVAPGVGCWGELWPAITNAAVNINNYVRDGAKLGTMGMMNTAWDDNGHNLFNYNWHGLVWGAECSWNPASPLTNAEANIERQQKLKLFNTAFDEVFFKTPGITNQLILIDSLRFLEMKGVVSESAFWQDILEFYPENTSPDGVAKNLQVMDKAKTISKQIHHYRENASFNTAMMDGALLALQRVIFTAQKNIVRVDLYNAYQSKDISDIFKVKSELNDLITALYEIKKEYCRLWDLENRSWWLDKNLNDYNKLALQIQEVDKKVFIEPLPEIQDGKRAVVLRTVFDDKTIVFTLDGSTPNFQSEVYSEPLRIDGNATIKAAILEGLSVGKVSEKSVLMHKGIGRFKSLNSKYSSYNPAYAAGGEQALVDGLKGSASFSDGRWQGFQGTDLEIELDFKTPTEIHSVSCDFLRSSYSWILLPSEVQIYTSSDGTNYKLLTVIDHSIPQDDQKLLIHTFSKKLDKVNSRYLKIIAKNPGPLPSWHHAPGNPSFIFCDEIIVE